MLNIAICEDYSKHSEIILKFLDKYQVNRPGTKICRHSFSSGNELLESLDAGNVFNLFLLDILMPGLNGIELARKLRLMDADIPLVFITSSTDYALDAFSVSATHYLLKPVTENTLFPVLDKIVAAMKHEKERFFALATRDHILKIPFSSIVCTELVGRAVRIYIEKGDPLYSKSIRISFSKAVAPLLEDERFLHPHKSYVLNMEQVVELKGNGFTLKNNRHVPIPRYKYATAKAKYLSYLSSQGICLLGGENC